MARRVDDLRVLTKQSPQQHLEPPPRLKYRVVLQLLLKIAKRG